MSVVGARLAAPPAVDVSLHARRDTGGYVFS
jgi:hypothetical protein